ncbi:MAG: tetratricopeptide repeat protein, partial [Desulfobulbaceae bacterium]|nr:tetratricopeptide repeat protein [Desulfobulbaceae bacterium]
NGHPFQRVLQSGFHYRDFGPWERMLTESRVIFLYISLLFYPNPNRLNLDYDFSLSHGFIDPFVTLPAIAGLLALVVVAVVIARKERFISFVILWFLGTLFLESSFLGLDLVYEHRLYLPSAFALTILPVLAFRFARFRAYSVVLIVMVIILSGYWTYQRNHTWGDPVTFHEDMVVKAPGKFRAHFNLGLALRSVGRYAESIPEFNKTLQLEPRMLSVHSQLAYAYKKLGQMDRAVYHYNQVLALSPDDPATLSDLGMLYGQQGDLAKAIGYFAHALRIVPNDAAILLNMGTALHRQGDVTNALKFYQKSLQVNPENAMAYNNIGLIYIGWKQYGEAEKYIRKALAINPNHPNAQETLERISRLRNISP